MNQYHIYAAIGRGRYSTVYKGRKKKTIEYFAIKSVDKSQKSKVNQEVKILHSLDHPNVLKFYTWYETSAHMWLVLEYCVGGDLRTLLQQDGKLPEDSIYDLALELVKALQYLHSRGVIYSDLKPSNILLDENGHIKLCDFGLARKLGDISRTPSSLLPQAKRGTPFYMAPELFEDGGVHSYASDFWALGCVLYECFVGRPPFVGREFTQLVKSILSDPTPPLPGNASRSFTNLINSLLVKDPAQRIQWPDLCSHIFWRAQLGQVSLPPQPAFDSMVDLWSRPCLSERNGDVKNKTPPKYREKDAKGTLKQDENSTVGSRGHETPSSTPSSRKTQMKVPAKAANGKHKDSSSASRQVNVLRLSRIAKTNLQRENEKENYRRPLQNGTENNTEVKIENTDMELDFDENNDDDGQDESDGSDNPASTFEEKLSTEAQHQEKAEDLDSNSQMDNATSSDAHPSDESRACDEKPSSENIEVAAPATSVSPQVKIQRGKEASGCIKDYDPTKSSSRLSDVLWHLSDLSVRPVMPSKKADKEVIRSLPFEALQASEFVKETKEQLDAFSSRVTGILSSSTTSILEKQNIIRYLEVLSANAEAANILTNGPIMLLLVKMLRLSKIPALRVQLASLIGLLIRHSTFIEDDLANSGIISSLTNSIRDKNDRVRRFAMAALGELLFYISTQNEHTKDFRPSESPSKESRSTSGWQVPNSLIILVCSVLRKGEDDITQLYALRTIENICSQGAYWAARFTSQDLLSNLCYIYKAAGKQESMRLTAGSCLVRLVRFNPSCIQSVAEKLSFKDIASALAKGNPREQQICLNLLCMAFLGSHTFPNIGRHLVLLGDDKNLVPNLVSLVEHGSEALRAKALVLVALLCKHNKRWLPHFFCNPRLLPLVDRLAKEKESYLQQCLEAFLHVIGSALPALLDAITGDIHQLMGAKRHGQISGVTGRAAHKTNVHLFPVVFHLLGSSSFKTNIVSHQVLLQLANLLRVVENPFQGRDDFQITLLQVLECVAEEPPLVIQNQDTFISDILPSLTVLYKGNKDGNARFLCLKILFDVMIILLNGPCEVQQRSDNLKSISNKHFLPLYPTLIEDEDPIPTYAQKLLVMLIEFNYIRISDILHLKTVSQCFEFLLGDFSSININSVKLCLALASAPEMDPGLLSQLKVVRRIGNLLEFVYAKDMDDFLEPAVGLCRAFLLRSLSSRKGFGYSKEPRLLDDGYSETNRVMDQQQCIRDIMDFGSNVGVLLELSRSESTDVADVASECLVLLLMAAPREATTGFLTNLSKVTLILEARHRATQHLVLQRMLHALGYSCRQYLSHAMILSISALDLSRIESIVSEIRSTGGVPALVDVAVLVASELQRLPRCA